jgi:Domain of unknown function (DUF4129)
VGKKTKVTLLKYSFLFLLLSQSLVFAQKPDSAKAIVQQLDQSNISCRRPAQERLNDYRNDRDYQYGQDTAPPQNPIAQFWYWLMKQLSDFFISKSFDSFWQYVILAVVAVLALWLIWKADFVKGLFVSQSENQNGLDYETLTENIHELNFGDLLENARSQHNYRLAVRYLYLQTLKKLADAQLISWQPNKTNRMYANELSANVNGSNFENITRQFEYVWYGERPIIESEFMDIQSEFNDFSKSIIK